MKTFMSIGRIHATLAAAGLLWASAAHADSVAQVATAKRISRQTVTLLDPQGRPTGGSTGSDTTAQVGDILTFVIQFTPVPNGAYRGMGGYITDYVPGNTEVVGARIVDANGNTVRPHRGGLTSDGVGPRGPANYVDPLVEGSMSQLYADTGIFYSTDARTRRTPSGTTPGEAFLTLKNGLEMNPVPTGAGQLAGILNTTAPYYAHNEWDLIQVFGFGSGGASLNGRGQGNTPEHVGSAGIGYGSPVAGPDSWYQLEATYDSTLGPLGEASVVAAGDVGPWRRIRTTGGEIGQRGEGDNPPSLTQVMPDPGLPVRIGIPAVDPSGALFGWDLSPDNPLPPATNAVRFALGELVVGDEYYAEISLRVTGLPLDPDAGMDINCAEVMGGDASAMAQDGAQGGKDNVWRYFLPAPACVLLNLLFENRVDQVIATNGDTLTYTIDVKNLSTVEQTGVVIRDCYGAGDISVVAAATTPGYTVDNTGAGCPVPAAEDALVWDVGTLAPGEERQFVVVTTASRTTTNRAVYTSDALPTPGFTATAFTTIEDVAVMRMGMTATPDTTVIGDTVHYTATVQNVGTGPGGLTGCAGPCYFQIVLPAGFTYVAATAEVDGVAVGIDVVQNGQLLQFIDAQLGASIAPGATITIEFDALIDAAVADGVYTSEISTWVSSAKDLEDAVPGVAAVVVGTQRSDTPSVAALVGGATTVTVTTTEGSGATVTVYVNGNPAGTATVGASGTVTVTVPTLFGGQHVTATVTAAGEVESPPSTAVVVSSGVGGNGACGDGLDNDGDGFVDFPDDPGCEYAADPDETDVAACADGLDNDTDGVTDFPDDPSCSSFVDDDESGAPECGDGVDNDGSGLADFPDDPGCTDSNDAREGTVPACANGTDDDTDGVADYPADPGCANARDTSETDEPGAGGADGGPVSGGGTTGAGAADAAPAVPESPPDLGGVDAATAAASGSGDEGGCGCRTSTKGASSGAWLAMALAGLAVRRRRRLGATCVGVVARGMLAPSRRSGPLEP